MGSVCAAQRSPLGPACAYAEGSRAAGAARASQELGVCESRVQTAEAFEKVLAYRTAAWSR